MVKTIVTTTASATTTPDSHEDDNFCEDDNFHKDDCEYNTCNGNGEDDRDYYPRLP